ncbi:hypothetical protein BDN67DRAFT_279351 [Paxillus ammoniavirescens]|nr:hypothetical protein BDN67DRAFT_279351 [Paxillus ammoniavirescens]
MTCVPKQTQPQPDHQQGAGGAEAGADEIPSQELTAKDKGKQREADPNPAPASPISRASTPSTTSASQSKHRIRNGIAGIMRRRNGSPAQAHNRSESTPLAEGNSTEVFGHLSLSSLLSEDLTTTESR